MSTKKVIDIGEARKIARRNGEQEKSAIYAVVDYFAGKNCKSGRDVGEDTCLKCGKCGRKFDQVGKLRK